MADYRDVSDPALSPALTSGANSVQSSKLVQQFSSKLLRNRGQQQQCIKTPATSSKPPETLEQTGAGVSMAGGLGFGGSMLGEVIMSYSTSTIPPSKRHSISATAARYEELAAEAGIDLDISEVNIEDLRVHHRMEGGSGYVVDGDDNNAGDDLDDDANAANQKLARKERSIMQMVGLLRDRMAGMNAVVVNRFCGCKSDLDETTHFRSSRTKQKMAMAFSNDGEDWNVASPRKASEKAKRGWNVSSYGGEGGSQDGGSDIAARVGSARTTFRNAPQTDAGRRLAHHFEQEYGSKRQARAQKHRPRRTSVHRASEQASSAVPKFRKTTSSKAKQRVDHYNKRNVESRKQKRLHFECKLQSNLDQYVTRAVTELVYRVPDKISEGVKGDLGPESNEVPRQDASPIMDDRLGDGFPANVFSEATKLERFPIPLEPNEMNPKLLLAYACERAVFPGGARIFKRFATSADSQDLFVYMFWFIHCNFFQEDSQREQTHLLRCAESRYVGVLGAEGMGEYKDFFFKYYPFIIANAVLWGFHHLCPGSRHLYSKTFKRVLYLQCARILGGIEVTPSSIVEMRTKLFPDETADATDEREFQYQPDHVHGLGMHSVNAGPAAPSMTKGFSPPSEASGVRDGDGSSVLIGTVSRVDAPGEAGSNVAMAGTSTDRKRWGQKEGNGADKEESAVIQRMTKTFRPNPLGLYTANRSALRFKPGRLDGLAKLKPRQQRTVFDASQISPMLQEYLRQSSSTAGRRPENLIWTVPVAWCETGGTDTYRRRPSRKELHDLIKSEHVKAKREFLRAKGRAAGAMQRALRHVEADRKEIFKKGPRKVGLKSMDIVTELQKQGPRKEIGRTVR